MISASPPKELLEQLWRDPRARSRNRNFSRFRDDPQYRTAVKHVRSLLALRRDILRYQGESELVLSWLPACDGARLTFTIPALRFRRSLLLTLHELELLRGDPVWQHTGVSGDASEAISRCRTR